MNMKNFWDFARILLSTVMSVTGAFLLGMLAFHAFGLKSQSPVMPKLLLAAPFVVFAYFLGKGIFMVCLRLRQKCKNEWDFWMIMLSFSLAGMFIMPVRKLIFHLVGITVNTPLWIKVLVYIPIIPPTYYVGLLIFGTLLGQSSFFLGMIAKRIAFITGRKK